MTDERTVWLRVALSLREAAWTTLHECRHLCQTLANRARPGADGQHRPMAKERRAAMEAFAREHVDAMRW